MLVDLSCTSCSPHRSRMLVIFRNRKSAVGCFALSKGNHWNRTCSLIPTMETHYNEGIQTEKARDEIRTIQIFI